MLHLKLVINNRSRRFKKCHKDSSKILWSTQGGKNVVSVFAVRHPLTARTVTKGVVETYVIQIKVVGNVPSTKHLETFPVILIHRNVLYQVRTHDIIDRDNLRTYTSKVQGNHWFNFLRVVKPNLPVVVLLQRHYYHTMTFIANTCNDISVVVRVGTHN